MSRLTVKSTSSDMVWFDGGSYQHEPCEMSYHEVGEVLRKLEKYEDAEEQGLLFKTPCKVGDTVFVLEENNCKECRYYTGKPLRMDSKYCSHNYTDCPKKVVEVIVVGFEISEEEINLVKKWGCYTEDGCETEIIQKPFFLTKQEAEQLNQPPYITDEEFVEYKK